MRIQFLGTGSAEGWPALFCNCSACRTAMVLKGRNLRSRSSVLVDQILKIDFPADTLYHSIQHGLDTSAIRYLLITHSHYDHFAPGDLEWIAPRFATRAALPELQIVANEDVIHKLNESVKADWPTRLTSVVPFQTVAMGDYLVTTIPANHNIDKHPLTFLIRTKTASFLYACDTGEYSEETWKFLEGAEVDLVIVECTFGNVKQPNSSPHLGLPNIVDWKVRAEASGFARKSTRWVLTHISHIAALTHDELIDVASQHGLLVAFDGMQLALR